MNKKYVEILLFLPIIICFSSCISRYYSSHTSDSMFHTFLKLKSNHNFELSFKTDLSIFYSSGHYFRNKNLIILTSSLSNKDSVDVEVNKFKRKSSDSIYFEILPKSDEIFGYVIEFNNDSITRRNANKPFGIPLSQIKSNCFRIYYARTKSRLLCLNNLNYNYLNIRYIVPRQIDNYIIINKDTLQYGSKKTIIIGKDTLTRCKKSGCTFFSNSILNIK